ncbi:hypothetical protein K3X48_05065 [Aliiroseovarius crassostreae]|uniref:Uncharacterized protein n=1 Tax=Aliiroseovarius crassostreae TaxID=154981 RepID=A0A9Q9HEH0_9RHOB|nr:hypothetical protein [Aliiroseovarius crassostreae]UWP96356.1 hypothetical protein K3X48_05065 [Aliiroseovarius crassostreae]
MSVLINDINDVKSLGSEDQGPELTHTRWGYMITSCDAAGVAMRAGYLLLRYGGIVLFLVAVGLWVMPGASVHPDIIPFKIGVSVLFALLGSVLFWSGTNDRCGETQVDLERRQLRRGLRRANGRFSVVAEMPLQQAGDLFVSRPAYEGDDAVLYVRRNDAPLAFEVAAGPEDLLYPLLKRIKADMRRAALAT